MQSNIISILYGVRELGVGLYRDIISFRVQLLLVIWYIDSTLCVCKDDSSLYVVFEFSKIISAWHMLSKLGKGSDGA